MKKLTRLDFVKSSLAADATGTDIAPIFQVCLILTGTVFGAKSKFLKQLILRYTFLSQKDTMVFATKSFISLVNSG